MYPQKLGAVTRKKTVIDKILESAPVDLETLKFQYTAYLEQVEQLQAACISEEDKAWLEPHKIEINEFRVKIQGYLDSKISCENEKSRGKSHGTIKWKL